MMPDGEYTAHIIAEVTRHRSNPAAIRLNLLRLTGRDYELREPWKEVAYLSQSRLSGGHHLQGAPIYQYHTLQVQSLGGCDWSEVTEQVTADKPAGTLLLHPATIIGEIRVTGMAVAHLLLVNRVAVRHITVFWNTSAWTEGEWDSRRWSENARNIAMTGLPGS